MLSKSGRLWSISIYSSIYTAHFSTHIYILKALYNVSPAYISPSDLFIQTCTFPACASPFSDPWLWPYIDPIIHTGGDQGYFNLAAPTPIPTPVHPKSYSKVHQLGSFTCIGGQTPIQWHLSLRSHTKNWEGSGRGLNHHGLDYLTALAEPIHLSVLQIVHS